MVAGFVLRYPRTDFVAALALTLTTGLYLWNLKAARNVEQNNLTNMLMELPFRDIDIGDAATSISENGGIGKEVELESAQNGPDRPSDNPPYAVKPFDDWCPSKKCSTHPSLCQQQFLFVVSSGGRTGSTSLMHALNAIDDIWINGEAKYLIMGLRLAFRGVVPRSSSKDEWIDGETSVGPHWHSKIDRQRVLKLVQEFVKHTNLPPSNRRGRPAVIGFKDIDWEPEDVRFAEEAMPCSKFIFNYRQDVAHQATSMFHKQNKDSLEILRNRTRDLLATQKTLQSPSFILPLEDFSARNFTRLAHWLGANCAFTNVSHHNLGGYAKGAPSYCVPIPSE